MASSAVIKEFLVALGVTVDEPAIKRFKTGITDVTKAVVKLGAVIEATGLGIAIGVAKWASSLEQLWFASQRLGSSASSIRAFDLASRNFGDTIEGAQSSLEGLAAFERNNPAGLDFVSGWLGTIGESAKDAHGNAKSVVEQVSLLGKLFASQRAHGQTFLANQIAGQLGIGDRTMLAMSTPGFAEELARQEKRAKGWEAVAKGAHLFRVQLEDLKMQVEQLLLRLQSTLQRKLGISVGGLSVFLSKNGKKIVDDITAAVGFLVDKFNELLAWFNQHPGEIAKRLDDIRNNVQQTYAIIKPAMEWLWQQFKDLDAATDGWSTKLLAVLATLKILGATGLVTGIANLGAALAKGLGVSLAAAATASEGADVWAVVGTAWGVAAGAAIGIAIAAVLDHYFPNNPFAKVGQSLGSAVYDATHPNAPGVQGNPNDPANYYATHYPWEKPSTYALDNPSRAEPVAVHFTTAINVSGANMAKEELARAIADQQQRVNAQLVREFSNFTQ
jgi:hypothetical protein